MEIQNIPQLLILFMEKTKLDPRTLVLAYSEGFFPMPDENSGEILWFRPDPRTIIPLDGFHQSRSLRSLLRKKRFQVTYNQSFSQVMHYCSQRPNTWINDEFKAAYQKLHTMKIAHSVETWKEGQLVGGVYGVCFGGAFFAESMFYRASNASKVALYHLVEKLRQKKFHVLECQFMTDHLRSLGAKEISDTQYMKLLKHAINQDIYFS